MHNSKPAIVAFSKSSTSNVKGGIENRCSSCEYPLVLRGPIDATNFREKEEEERRKNVNRLPTIKVVTQGSHRISKRCRT
jgi:hypothetical protein